jgi:transposase
LRLLIRYHQGESHAWRVVHVPSEQEEDSRRLHRELERLKKEQTAHTNRIRSLLALEGLKIKLDRRFLSSLESARLWDGSPLGVNLKAELVREYQRRVQAHDQILRIEKQRDGLLKEKSIPALKQVSSLMGLVGIGKITAWTLVHEFFGWRKFKNRKEVGSAAGLTGTPYCSGEMERDRGISKAGNRRVRALMIETAWRWLRHQPDSKVSLWFQSRFGSGGKRMRRIGIVAMARQLLVALWRHAQFGEVPEGARLMAS